ncbi:hypothetical protein Acsp03_67660 [Actinomadura sp. NBRC 104412]|uniref:hypothetical protein n=1 Tax=Actinomadura sp. NBRC 104412 TaxID=3032203 RepID=UPI00249FA590|nr:hypothetical protein [Actinomadura sp. NBRC 104412]GLZ09300.1 hypothetical protein Acsp03_67660 [Actinomadura sp. NBRC 104412]
MVLGPPGQPGWPSPLGQPTWPSAPGEPGWPPRRPAYNPPPTEEDLTLPPDADPFTAAEHHTRAVVTAPWWPAATPLQRRQALFPHLLSLPDHSWWLFAAWTRWYRWHPADSRWFPSPPPQGADLRRSAVHAPTPPPIPAEIIPTGPDYLTDYGPPLALVGRPVSGALTYRLRSVMSEAAQAPPADYPLGWNRFLHGTPSTIAATWSTLLWCASVPLFDPRLGLLDLWEPHLAPQPGADPRTTGPDGTNAGSLGTLRWLPPPPLHTIIGLYAERLRSGRADAAAQLIRCMVMTAQALRDDARFRVRASALLSMIEPLQTNPALDHRALPYGDQVVEREWRTRCPAPLFATLFNDSAPGEALQLAFYDLATALRPVCGDPGSPDFIEPRHAATALLAADLAGYRPDLAAPVGRWLDPELRALLADILNDDTHPLRSLWPSPTGGDAATTTHLLSATAGLGFAWCRLTGVPVPPNGLTATNAQARHLATLEDG